MRKSWLLLAGTSLVAALGAWVAFGTLAVTDLSVVPRRVGLLPAWWWLPAAAAVFAAFLALRPGVARGPWWLLLLLVLPWLPVPVPAAFLVWTGPLAWWVWAGTVVAVGVASWPAPLSAHSVIRGWLGSPRRAPLLALALALVGYLAAARLVSNVLPAGDEPHYLVITQSLLKDQDLRIENNHRQEDYTAYFRGVLRPDYLRRGQDGEIYSIHAPGLSAVILPAFALGGYPGVIAFLAFVSALGTWLVWRTAYALTGSAGAAWFGWAAAALGTPFFFHAFTAYPDGLGAVIVMTGVHSLVRLELEGGGGTSGTGERSPSRWWWVVQGALLALLPWLHTRYAGAAAVLGMALGLRLLGRRDHRALAFFVSIPALSAAAWFGSFYVIYGEFNPAAPYGDYTQTKMSNIPRGLVGLFLDQQFGILPNAPTYALALAGLVVSLRRRTRLAIELALLLVTYLALVAVYHMWWGGWSAPARFAVPVLLMLGVPAAVWWASRGSAGKAVGGVALAVTALITVSLVVGQDGRLIFNDRDGFGRWLEWVSPLVDLPRAVPSFFRSTPLGVVWRSALWFALFGAGALLLTRVAGRNLAAGVRRARLALLAPVLFVAVLTAGVALSWSLDKVVPVTPTSAQLAMIRSFDPSARPVGIQYRPLRLVEPRDAVGKLQIANSRRRTLPDDYPLLLLGDVPAGTYRLAPSAVASLRGVVEVVIGRSPHPIARWNFDETPRRAEYLLRLPTGVDAVVLRGDERARRSAPQVLSMVPVSVVAASDERSGWRANRAAAYGPVVVFAPAERVYLEEPGFWVEGGVEASLAITSEGGTAVSFLVRNGASSNVVHLQSGRWSERLEMQPREERVLAVPVDAEGMAGLIVRTEKGFRPADVEPASRDERYLGAWLQPLTP